MSLLGEDKNKNALYRIMSTRINTFYLCDLDALKLTQTAIQTQSAEYKTEFAGLFEVSPNAVTTTILTGECDACGSSSNEGMMST